MSYNAFLSTDFDAIKKLKSEFDELFSLELIDVSEKMWLGLNDKLSKNNIYYLISHYGDSNGFIFDSNEKIDNDEIDKDYLLQKKSVGILIKNIKKSCDFGEVEMFTCFSNEWNQPIINRLEIYIHNVSLEKNYFGINDRQLILFR